MQSTRYSCQILTKLEFSRDIFENILNIRFYRNPSGGERADRRANIRTDRWTDGRNEANSCSSQFCERAKRQYKNTG